MAKKIVLSLSSVCNLSRIPLSINNNPLRKTAQLLILKKDEEAHEFLFNYYKNLNYKTMNDVFRTDISTLESFKHNDCFLPWYHTDPITVFKDNAFISRLSDKDIRKKILKVKSLITSIEEHGYDPDRFLDRKQGHITGYFLEREEKKSFYVVSGNHRVATLSALGYHQVNAMFEDRSFLKPREVEKLGYEKLPNTFSEKNIKTWPSVQSGFFTYSDALTILGKFV